MAGVQVDRGSMVKVARQLGQQGKPLPAEMAGDPEYQAAYDQGAGRAPAPATKPPPTKPPVTKVQPARRSAASRSNPATPPDGGKGRKNKKPPGYFSRAFSPSAAASSSGATGAVQSVKSAGDGGGLLLALVVYPVLLATFKYGAQGPSIWFHAKWLNKTTGAAATPSAAAPATSLPSATKHQVTVPGAGHRTDIPTPGKAN